MSLRSLLLKSIPFLEDLEFNEFVFQPEIHPSFASSVIEANLPYKPGIYIVFDFTSNIKGDLLYVGKAGANKDGLINSHQIPKRLLAVCYPPDKYLNKMPSSHPSRNDAWPIMMKEDGISKIIICCFFSKIDSQFMVTAETNPLALEKKVNKIFKEKGMQQQWSKRK